MRLAERLRPGRQTLKPALPSRFERAKTSPEPETFRWEADESFAVADDKDGHNSSAARLIPHDVARQASFSVGDTLEPRESVGPTVRVANQTSRAIRDPEKIMVEATLSASPTENRSQAATESLDRTAKTRGSSPSLVVRRSAIESVEAGASERPVTAVRSTEREQFVLSPSTRRQITPEDESRLSPAALEPSQWVQPRVGGAEHESATGTQPAEREIQHERGGPANLPALKSAMLRGELVPSSASFRRRIRSAEQEEAHDPSFLESSEIRVTIGRIEVRAITPPAVSQSPAAPRTPKISLDDYLRSRNGTAA